jgi:hypothetical protein
MIVNASQPVEGKHKVSVRTSRLHSSYNGSADRLPYFFLCRLQSDEIEVGLVVATRSSPRKADLSVFCQSEILGNLFAPDVAAGGRDEESLDGWQMW